MYNLLVLVLLFCIMSSLGCGLFYLVRDQGGSTRTVKALTFRIVLSFSLFALIIYGLMTGQIASVPG